MKTLFVIGVFLILTVALQAQSIVLVSGSLAPLKSERVIKFEFTYNEMFVGKMTESEYIEKKVGDYNAKEAGKGDTWKKNWVADRKGRFEPQFIELFNKYMEEKQIVEGVDGAKYVVVINTDFTEPGFNVGVVRRNASVDLSCKIMDITSGEQLASIRIRDASANSFWGTDFDSGFRLQESYGKAGREFAKFLIKKGKL